MAAYFFSVAQKTEISQRYQSQGKEFVSEISSAAHMKGHREESQMSETGKRRSEILINNNMQN